MTRTNIFSAAVLVCLSVFAALWFDVLQFPGVSHAEVQFHLQKLPVWAVTLLATYCVLDLVSSVISIGDAKDAKEALLRDIAAAKKDLDAKGIKTE